MRTKLNDINIAVNVNKYDVIVVTETWLNDNINDGEIFDARYNIYRRDRESSSLAGKEGGGVLIAVSKAYDSARACQWETTAEDLWVRVKINEGKKINICAVYLPPPVTLQHLDMFLSSVTSVNETTGEEMIVIGDFNLGFIEWKQDPSNLYVTSTIPSNYTNNLGYSLIDFMSLNSLLQYNVIKNTNNRTLDLVFSNMQGAVVRRSVSPICKEDCHHPPLEINFIVKAHVPLKRVKTSSFNFKAANYELINLKLREIRWKELLEPCVDVNVMLGVFYESVQAIIEDNIPKIKHVSQNFPPWYSKTLVRVLNEKEKHRKRFKKYGNPRDEIEYRLLDERARLIMKNCYRKYVYSVENNIRSNPKAFWSKNQKF